MVNVDVFNIGSICIHRKELLRKFTFHQKYREQSHDEIDVRHIWKVDSGTIRWDFWSVTNQLGKFSMERIISGQWWRSHQSLAREGLRIFRFSVMPWKDESEPNIKYCLGTTVGLVQIFTTIQNFGHNWRRTDGIRVAYLPWIHHIAARQQSPRVHDQKWATHHNSKDQLSSCRCSMRSYVDLTLFAKRFPPGRWSFLGPGSENKWYSIYNARPQGEWDRVAEWWWSNSEKADTQSSDPQVHCPDERLKAKEVGNYQYTSALLVKRLKLFFAQSVNQLSIYGAVSDLCDEYKACQAKMVRLVLAEQSDPLFEPASLLMKTPTPSTEDPAQEDLLQKYHERVKKTSTTKWCDLNLYWCRILDNSWSRTVLHDKGHWRVLTIHRTSDMSWVHVTTRWQINWPERLDSREHQNWTRNGSHNQLLTR